jgi:pimeloyl-ACP methyl ester carboxylesterase
MKRLAWFPPEGSLRVTPMWLALAALAGCASMHAPVPMTAQVDAVEGGGARCLIVFLPGYGDQGDTFRKEGFVDLVRRARLSADVIAADATFPYYVGGTFVERLETDLIAPARRRGYARTWLIGASMGGFGALLYSAQRPAQVDGVLALAPYLGDQAMLGQIRDAGGLARWQAPPAAEPNADNFQPQIWRWLKEVLVEGRPGPALWLGWGTRDRLRDAAGLMAAAMPPERVLNAPGGHDWRTWRRLMEQFLERSPMAAECAP